MRTSCGTFALSPRGATADAHSAPSISRRVRVPIITCPCEAAWLEPTTSRSRCSRLTTRLRPRVTYKSVSMAIRASGASSSRRPCNRAPACSCSAVHPIWRGTTTGDSDARRPASARLPRRARSLPQRCRVAPLRTAVDRGRDQLKSARGMRRGHTSAVPCGLGAHQTTTGSPAPARAGCSGVADRAMPATA